jgi:hypothetical protein
MRETRTPIGLTVSCSLDARNDPAEIKLLPERRKQIRPRRPSVPPPGNGTLLTRPSRNPFLPAARANRGPNLEKSSHFFRGGCPAWGKSQPFEAKQTGAPAAGLISSILPVARSARSRPSGFPSARLNAGCFGLICAPTSSCRARVEEDEEAWLACAVPVVALLEFADTPRNFPQVAGITVRKTRVERRR